MCVFLMENRENRISLVGSGRAGKFREFCCSAQNLLCIQSEVYKMFIILNGKD